MKKILVLACCLCLLCGCIDIKDPAVETQAPVDTSYATQYLEYESTDGTVDFSLSGEVKPLKIGDSLGEFTLTKLLTRVEEESTVSVRATFDCDFTASGTFTHLQNSNYGQLIRFYPDENTAFPQPSGMVELDDWFVVLENNNPAEVLGFDGVTPVEITATVKITSFTVNTSPNNTVKYVEIAPIE